MFRLTVARIFVKMSFIVFVLEMAERILPNGAKIIESYYGQLIVGPPGSGKTTYCHYAHKIYSELGRKVAIVNLDPANENMLYKADVDIMDLITLQDVMETQQLGPNGALLFCIEYLEENCESWLKPALERVTTKFNYLLFDCPGQMELYTHHASMSRIFQYLQSFGYQLTTVNLIDAHYCSDPSKFISTLLLALNTMLRMSLPHVNVLSKADLLKEFEDKLHFSVEYYTEVLNLNYLLECLNDCPSLKKFRKLNSILCTVIEDFSLVSFHLLDARRKKSMLQLRNVIDKTNGYLLQAGEEQSNNLFPTDFDDEEENKNSVQF